MWQLPLDPFYDKMIRSKIADVKNIGGANSGSITAAQFLKRFIEEGTAWAHLDIAGVAWQDGEQKPMIPSWGTGWGVRLLNRLVHRALRNMTETLFYHLERRALEDVLPGLVEKSLERGWRARDQDRIRRNAPMRWTICFGPMTTRASSPMPNRATARPARQPVLITVEEDNPNGAQILFCVGGAAAFRLGRPRVDLARVVLLFDGRDAEALAEAARRMERRQGQRAMT